MAYSYMESTQSVNLPSIANNEPQLLALFRASGLTGPVPVITKSGHLLVEIINSWKRQHPNQRVPGYIGDGKGFRPRMLYFGKGSNQVLHDILEIGPSQFVRIAKGIDESCMLLIPHAKNTRAWLGYHAWLGEFGSSKYTILHSCERTTYEKRQAEKKQKTKTSYPFINLNSISSSELLDEPSERVGPRSPREEFQQAGRKCYSFPTSVTKREFRHILPPSKRSAQGLSCPSPVSQLTSRSGIVPILTPLQPKSTPSISTVRFQFLTADESFGAVPKPLDRCLTLEAFFDKAFAAFTIVGQGSAYSQMAGVKVTTPAERPIFVPWRNQESFEEMVDMVKERAAGRTGRLDVEVTCVPKSK